MLQIQLQIIFQLNLSSNSNVVLQHMVLKKYKSESLLGIEPSTLALIDYQRPINRPEHSGVGFKNWKVLFC